MARKAFSHEDALLLTPLLYAKTRLPSSKTIFQVCDKTRGKYLIVQACSGGALLVRYQPLSSLGDTVPASYPLRGEQPSQGRLTALVITRVRPRILATDSYMEIHGTQGMPNVVLVVS
jgi:hypothetical protein